MGKQGVQRALTCLHQVLLGKKGKLEGLEPPICTGWVLLKQNDVYVCENLLI